MHIKRLSGLAYHIFTALLLSVCLSGFAQNSSEDIETNNSEIWTDFTLTKQLNEKWSLGGDIGYRTPISNSSFNTYYIRPFASYKFNSIYKLTGGMGSFNTFRETANSYEFRLYQDLNINWPKLGIFNFTHRFRLEERFFFYSNNSVKDDIVVRGRYLISFRTDKFGIGGRKHWSVYVSLEPFFRFTGVETFQANNFRWDTALAYHINEKWKVELHYILQNSEIFARNNINESVFRLRFNCKLD